MTDCTAVGVSVPLRPDAKSRLFFLMRLEDESGVSGLGNVAVGVQFPSGNCVIEWLVEPHTHGWYDNVEDVVRVHGHGGKTIVCWEDGGVA